MLEKTTISPHLQYTVYMASYRRFNTAKRDEEELKKKISFQLKKKNFIKDPERI